MTTIPFESVPESLKGDKTVASYITKAIELEEINPIVSYYCKIYILEYILNNKLHIKTPENEEFTIKLLDVTETIKKSEEDETIHQVLNNKQLSINTVFSFSFKIFNSSLQDLSNYDGLNKGAILSKFRAAIDFLSLITIFTENDDSTIDYGKITGGKCTTNEEFDKFIKSKIKICKFQMSKLIKDEVPIKQIDDKELEDELDQELDQLKLDSGADEDTPELPGAPNTLPDSSDDVKLPGAPSFLPDDDSDVKLPGAPSFLPDTSTSQPKDLPNFLPDEDESDPSVSLPGAPHFAPDSSDDVKLPGAPKFLPDSDDLSHINKKSSIQVFPPDNNSRKPSTASIKQDRVHKSGEAHITRDNVNSILDTTEHIAAIQKHAKFAISALNYEDLATAEAELTKSLELLRSIK